jgi:hypothetical protein
MKLTPLVNTIQSPNALHMLPRPPNPPAGPKTLPTEQTTPVCSPLSKNNIDISFFSRAEFAFEIGSGLITEIRRLQSLLTERDKTLQDMKEEKDDLDRAMENLRATLRTQESNAGSYLATIISHTHILNHFR